MVWDVIFYATAEGSVPGADFIDGCPAKVRGTILAVLDAVAAAPPPTLRPWSGLRDPSSDTWLGQNQFGQRLKCFGPSLRG